ncbi:hypothetical protein [Candidatus Allofournierella excrementavium]|uniref:hypothetical protein n=1 Tax=Candidatus Allofournierella excrementavium TaxID=2838591 RepID=UPI003AEF7B86
MEQSEQQCLTRHGHHRAEGAQPPLQKAAKEQLLPHGGHKADCQPAPASARPEAGRSIWPPPAPGRAAASRFPAIISSQNSRNSPAHCSAFSRRGEAAGTLPARGSSAKGAARDKALTTVCSRMAAARPVPAGLARLAPGTRRASRAFAKAVSTERAAR